MVLISIIQSAFIILLVLCFNWILNKLLWKLRCRFLENCQIAQMTLVSALYTPLSYLAWFAAIAMSVDLLTFAIFDFRLFDLTLTLSIASMIALAWFLMRWKLNWVNEMRILHIEQRTAWTPEQIDLISKLATVIIFTVVGLQVMQIIGINVQTLIAFGGISGLAIAFASQQVIANFFGGLTIYFTRPFSIGEMVSIPERKVEGVVEDIGWYMTTVRSLEKKPVYIPNSIFTQTLITTPSRMTHRRIKEGISLRYEDSPTVPKIIVEIKKLIANSPDIDQKQRNIVRLMSLKPLSLDIELIAYIPNKNIDQNRFEEIRQDLLLQAMEIVSRHGAKFSVDLSSIIPT